MNVRSYTTKELIRHALANENGGVPIFSHLVPGSPATGARLLTDFEIPRPNFQTPADFASRAVIIEKGRGGNVNLSACKQVRQGSFKLTGRRGLVAERFKRLCTYTRPKISL